MKIYFNRQILAQACLLLAATISTYPLSTLAAPGDPLSAPVEVLAQVMAGASPQYPEVTTDRFGQTRVAWYRGVTIGSLAVRRFSSDLTPLSGDVVVDPAMRQPASGSSNTSVAVATNRTGVSVLAYRARADERFGDSIYAQIIRPDGSMLPSPILVAETPRPRYEALEGLLPIFETGSSTMNPRVAIDDSGEFAVAWTDQEFSTILVGGSGIEGGRTRVLARRYRSDGTAISDAIVLARRSDLALPLNSIADTAQILSTSDGRFAVVFASGIALGGLRTPFTLQYIDRNGVADGLPIKLETGGDGANGLSVIDFRPAIVDGGQILLAWLAENPRDRFVGPQTVILQRYSRIGRPLTRPARVAERSQIPICCTLRVIPFPNGAIGITWQDSSDGFKVRARYYAADLSPLTESFVLVNGTTDASAVADANGNLVVAYGTPDSMPQPRQLYLQRFQGP